MCLHSCGPKKPLVIDDQYGPFSKAGSLYGIENLVDSTGVFRLDILWKKELRFPISQDISIAFDFLLIPSPDKKLNIISANNGAGFAEIKFREPIMAPVVAVDSLAVLNIGGEKLLVENWVSGEIKWEAELGGAFVKPLVRAGKLFWLDGLGYLRCFDIDEGKRIWDYRMDGTIITSPSANSQGIVVSTDNGRIRCFDPDSGISLWTFDSNGGIRHPPLIVDDHLFFITANGIVGRLKMVNGESEWISDLHLPVFAPLASDGPGLFIGTNSRQLIRLDSATGEMIWKTRIDGPVKAAPVILGRLAVFASLDHNVYFVDKHTGKIEFVYETGGMITSNPVVRNDRLYLGGEDQHLYCFQIREVVESGR
jgi:outer membrane protein assembly factor BamB